MRTACEFKHCEAAGGFVLGLYAAIELLAETGLIDIEVWIERKGRLRTAWSKNFGKEGNAKVAARTQDDSRIQT
jgi:hypothetical protein